MAELVPSEIASAPAFDALGVAAELLLSQGVGTLATLEAGAGFPLATLVTVGLDGDGVPLIFVSALSAHTKNLMADPRFSLLLAAAGKGDPLAHPRVTLIGEAVPTEDAAAKGRFIARHPKARLYQDFPDFSLWRLEPERIHLNGGFARAHQGPAAPVLGRVRALL